MTKLLKASTRTCLVNLRKLDSFTIMQHLKTVIWPLKPNHDIQTLGGYIVSYHDNTI